MPPPASTNLSQHPHFPGEIISHAVWLYFRWHGQLYGPSPTDAFPSRQSAGVQVAKTQRFVKAHNQPECCFYCTDVEFLR